MGSHGDGEVKNEKEWNKTENGNYKNTCFYIFGILELQRNLVSLKMKKKRATQWSTNRPFHFISFNVFYVHQVGTVNTWIEILPNQDKTQILLPLWSLPWCLVRSNLWSFPSLNDRLWSPDRRHVSGAHPKIFTRV